MSWLATLAPVVGNVLSSAAANPGAPAYIPPLPPSAPINIKITGASTGRDNPADDSLFTATFGGANSDTGKAIAGGVAITVGLLLAIVIAKVAK